MTTIYIWLAAAAIFWFMTNIFMLYAGYLMGSGSKPKLPIKLPKAKKKTPKQQDLRDSYDKAYNDLPSPKGRIDTV